ncbi:MAG: pseudaminic acid cytidylyltransferase [Desulfobacter sp.]|nr:pseudaminic acid cytidylyltransferase [Desulfobacter sp.]
MNVSKAVAIIPARGGSKRIPRKNIKFFCGKPMMAYSIETALKSGLFDKIIVSTDDDEIAKTAVECGAEVPFVRPASLADDYATTIDVINHAIQWLNRNDRVYDLACCIYPTAPFVRQQDLKKGYEALKEKNINFAFPVTSFPSCIFRALKLASDKKIEMFWPENLNARTQDLPEAFHDVGQFYWGKTKSFLNTDSIFGNHTRGLIIPRYLAQDIDTPEDWEQAELFFKSLNQTTGSP